MYAVLVLRRAESGRSVTDVIAPFDTRESALAERDRVRSLYRTRSRAFGGSVPAMKVVWVFRPGDHLIDRKSGATP